MKSKENQKENRTGETRMEEAAKADIFHIVSKEEAEESSLSASSDIEDLENIEDLKEGEDILEDLFGDNLEDEAYKKADNLARWAGVNEVRIRKRMREREKEKEKAKASKTNGITEEKESQKSVFRIV